MQFLHPWFLLGLLGLAVPVLIHLVYKIKAREVEFPTIRFLREVDRQVARRQRLQELLLLLLRCLTLLLLALALAGPAWKPSGGTQEGSTSGAAVAIVLDDSYSMGIADGESSVFARGKAMTASILKTLGPGDAACVITSKTNAVMSRDPRAVEQTLEAMAPSQGGAALGPYVKAALKLLNDTDAVQRELYIVSDFQQRASDLKGIDFTGRNLTPVLVPVTPRRRENVTLTVLEQISPFATTAAPFRIRINASNRGTEPVSRNVSVTIDGAVAAEQLIALPGKSATTLAIDLNFDKPGWKTVAAEIEKDPLMADNRRLLAVRVRAKLGVLICRTPLQGGVPSSFYIEKALNPGGSASTGVSIDTCDPSKLSGVNLSNYAVVILAECAPTVEKAVTGLREFVADGGDLVIAGPSLDAGEYNSALAVEVPGFGPLSPGKVTGVLGEESESGRAESIKEIDPYHPLFARLRRNDAPFDIAGAVFYRASKIEAFTSAGTRTIARFSGGDPAIMERAYGLGRVVLFAAPLHTRNTNLPLKVSFLPMMHSLIVYLTSPAEAQTLRVGDSIRLRLSAEGAPKTVKFHWNGGAARDVQSAVANNFASYDAGPASEMGVGTFDWSQNSQFDSRSTAVNVDPDEGELEYAEPAKVAPNIAIIQNDDELAHLLARIRFGQNLSHWFLAGGFSFLIAEALLANRFAFGNRAKLPEALEPTAAVKES